MLSQAAVQSVARNFGKDLGRLFPDQSLDLILFGSYARGDAEHGSDVDILILVDAPRDYILQVNWQVGELAADYLLEYGIMVSPIVENRAYFAANTDVLPFFQNIRREGVQVCA